MRPRSRLFVTFVLLVTAPAIAHDVDDRPTVVIDTDVGLDDVVTLAMVLQSPRVDVAAIVACEGVAGRARGVEYLERLLDQFNRKDVPLYAPAEAGVTETPPPFRDFAEAAVAKALDNETTPFRRPFIADAYATNREKTVVLALGPLTNLAAALREKPEIKCGIDRLIVAGSPDAKSNWNLRYDPDALAVVKASGVALEFVVPPPPSLETRRQDDLSFGQGTSLGEGFVNRLLTDVRVREHYLEQFGSFHDELVFLYLVDSSLFSRRGGGDALAPTNRQAIIHLFTRCMTCGRQHKARVVFAERPLPDNVLQPDVRERRARIIANNGEDEWFAQLLMNELHEHLGAYSVIGVKMGLRAAELLNAPQHAMKVVSHTAAHPPVSCLNDGIIVSTGSTPGRGLFSHVPGPPGSVRATFTYNGRSITLALKEEHQQKIRRRIGMLLEKWTPDDHKYWDGVRRLGLDIWENWHRRDLFAIVKPA
ncbi:MAG: nucleoside hydrolase [Phycisphaerae bacterium]|nr:nucleoside hydrolase [Phycisphaerae bacterium]